MCLKRDHGFSFNNLFDTMIAARVLGRKEVGLAALLNAEFGIEIKKTYQRANWSKRPLPPEYIHYARLDSRYLIALRQRMLSALRASQRLELAQEDFDRLRATPAAVDDREMDCRRVSGSNDLTPQQMAVLQALCEYRELQAELRDLPPFKVLQNSVLVGVATACPQNKTELEHLGLLNQRGLEQHARGLLKAVRHGLQSPPLVRPRNPRPSDAYLTRLDGLREWRKKTAAGMGVESDVVLPRDVMEALAGAAPGSPAELATVMATVPWRQAHFGNAILELMIPNSEPARNHH
jgi:ribonuclease D